MSYLIVGGSQEEKGKEIEKIAEKLGLKLDPNNPDILIIRPEKSIGIDQIRQSKSFLSQKSWQGGNKLVIVFDCQSMTLPAQNAFLKTLEEPPANSEIILTTNNQSSLLPTIISRCQLLTLISKKRSLEISFKSWQKIINLNLGQRLTLDLKGENVSRWIENYISCLQNKLVRDNSQSSKISHWLKLLASAQQMLNHNLNSQSVVDWLMVKL